MVLVNAAEEEMTEDFRDLARATFAPSHKHAATGDGGGAGGGAGTTVPPTTTAAVLVYEAGIVTPAEPVVYADQRLFNACKRFASFAPTW